MAEILGLHLSVYDRVTSIVRSPEGHFEVCSRDRPGRRHMRRASRGILATGYYDNPNLLGIPGEDLQNVSHYYTEAHPFAGQRVVVVGGGNSAVEAALDLFRHGARVLLVHRSRRLRDTVKYWILPDIQNRIRRGELEARFETRMVEISERQVCLSGPTGQQYPIASDYVFALTGYRPDVALLRSAGVRVDPGTLRPEHDPDTLETNIQGLYVAGGVTGGLENSQIFIENGRFHGEQIVQNLRLEERR